MKFNIGDEVRENPEYIKQHTYRKNGEYNRELVRLGRGRYLVVGINDLGLVVVPANWHRWEDLDGKTEAEKLVARSRHENRPVPAKQLLPYPKNQELEAKYTEIVERVKPQIEECLRMALTAIEDAERLADEHGIPFDGPCGLSQQYTPRNLPDLDPDTIEEITDVRPLEHQGWEQSAIC